MARKVTGVKHEKFIKTANQLGMVVQAKVGWTKVYPAGGSPKKSLGIQNTKNVTRVELVGFENAEFGIPHPAPPAKTVTQMLNFEQDEKLILRAFYKVAKALCEEVAVKVETTETAAPETTEVEVIPAAEVAAG